MSRIKAYVSHSIRGKFGKSATIEQMEANNQKAIEFGKQLVKEFSNVEFYIPADHDEFVLEAYKRGYVGEKEVLDVDCAIISKCNFIIIFSPDDYISTGMQIEIDHAVKSSIPVISAIDGTYEEYFNRIVYAINCHLTSMLR